MTAMKWWGWGHEDVSFTHDDKPELAPFIRMELDVDVERLAGRPIAFEDVEVAEPHLPDELRAALEAAVDRVSTDPLDRVVHARGKCLRDLVRHRSGDVGRVPDAVVRPGSEPEVEALVGAALTCDCVLIPFGGGTNIAGSLEPPRRRRPPGGVGRHGAHGAACSRSTRRPGWRGSRPACSAPTSRSSSARAAGPLGHFPDSFAHSTLGGWIATRSSGMQSDKYGDIADHHARRARGDAGRRPGHATRPCRLDRPDVRQMVLGSEGRLGIITEATVHVHRMPGRAHDPRLPVPGLAARAERDARDRGERRRPVGHPCLGRA